MKTWRYTIGLFFAVFIPVGLGGFVFHNGWVVGAWIPAVVIWTAVCPVGWGVLCVCDDCEDR